MTGLSSLSGRSIEKELLIKRTFDEVTSDGTDLPAFNGIRVHAEGTGSDLKTHESQSHSPQSKLEPNSNRKRFIFGP